MSRSGTDPFAELVAGVDSAARRPAPRRRRLGPGALLAAVAVTGATAFLALTGGGRDVRPAGQLLAEIDRIAVGAGFAISEVRLSGHQHTADREIFDAIAPFAGGSLAGLDVERAKAAIESLPWIATASLERILPDKLAIAVTERAAVAVWARGDRRTLVDRTGRPLSDVPAHLAEALGLIAVAGEGAPEAFETLDAALAGAMALRERMVLAERVGGRRWTLHLRGGVKAHLPAEELKSAVTRLAALVDAGRGADTMAVIDLRLADRTSLVPATRPSPAGPRG